MCKLSDAAVTGVSSLILLEIRSIHLNRYCRIAGASYPHTSLHPPNLEGRHLLLLSALTAVVAHMWWGLDERAQIWRIQGNTPWSVCSFWPGLCMLFCPGALYRSSTAVPFRGLAQCGDGHEQVHARAWLLHAHVSSPVGIASYLLLHMLAVQGLLSGVSSAERRKQRFHVEVSG